MLLVYLQESVYICVYIYQIMQLIMSKENVISFFTTLEPRVLKKTGKYPVSLIVYFNGKRRRYRTGKELSKEEWKKINSKKLKDESLKEAKEEIQDKVKRANDVKKIIIKDNIQFKYQCI